MWQNSHVADVYSSLPSPLQSGWTIDEQGPYEVEWISKEEQQLIHTQISYLTKGCTCKNGCTNRKCGCRKDDRYQVVNI